MESQLKLLPLIDRAGNVKYWADPRSGLMIDLDRNSVALITVDAVYGKQVFSLDGSTGTTSEMAGVTE
jgi:hypothetical protein